MPLNQEKVVQNTSSDTCKAAFTPVALSMFIDGTWKFGIRICCINYFDYLEYVSVALYICSDKT
jgi:hypothetical protein